MPPMMMIGISRAQKALAVARRRWRIGSGWPLGRSILRSTNRQVTIRPVPISNPGTMPETNRAEIEVLVVTP
jgi:hypothetical protein